MTINARLDELRKVMNNKGVDAVVIPTADRHQSEYVPTCWMDREWISGFTGSAGLAVITMTHAGVWTDSRYFIQAEEELADSEFILHKQIDRSRPEHIDWLVDQLSSGATVAVDGWNFTKGQWKQLEDELVNKGLQLIDADLISAIWNDRPLPSKSLVEVHPIQFAGKESKVKIEEVRDVLKQKNADLYVVTALDEIAWLLNLRGNDVDYNPVFISYVILNQTGCVLFVDENKISSEVDQYLNGQGVKISPYSDIQQYLQTNSIDKTTFYDPTLINKVLYKAIRGEKSEGESIIGNLKGIKNRKELANWENAMVKDGVALTHAFYWLEKTLENRSVSEVEFADKIAEVRSNQAGYKGESFGAIVGYNGNGAIIHYHAKAGHCKMIQKQGILLCDSGGQYVDGTTDITRTIALSTPTKEMKKHFTLVLKGMIGLSKAIFPEGTTGGQLDILARQHLWSRGLNFGHGTGHGVGFFLNVHEGPQGFSPINTSRGRKPLVPGMVTSNEPGYYIDNEYGIRIENLIVTQQSNYEGFLSFETMTLFPIDQLLMEEANLDSGEKSWINNYHNKVFQELSPFLEGDTKDWLQRKCKPLN